VTSSSGSRQSAFTWELGNRVPEAARALAYGRLLERLTAEAV
jgi:hypothetical protein